MLLCNTINVLVHIKVSNIYPIGNFANIYGTLTQRILWHAYTQEGGMMHFLTLISQGSVFSPPSADQALGEEEGASDLDFTGMLRRSSPQVL